MGVFLEKKTDESWHVPTLALNPCYAYVVHLEASYISYLVLNSSGIESDSHSDFPFASSLSERVPSTVQGRFIDEWKGRWV